MEPTPVPLEDVYVFFCLPINLDSVQRLMMLFSQAQGANVKHVHIAMNSPGGHISEGLALYSAFRAAPCELTVYNIGSVHSIAAVAFLGAEHRVCCSYGTFMFHRTTVSAMEATAEKLDSMREYVRIEDERTEALLREHVGFDDVAWSKLKTMDLFIAPNEAVRLGIVERIGDFMPPKGARLVTIGKPELQN